MNCDNCKKISRKRFSASVCVGCAKNPSWTKTELLVWLTRLARRLGRLPGRADITGSGSGPAVTLYYKKFGSLADAYRAAGLLKGDK